MFQLKQLIYYLGLKFGKKNLVNGFTTNPSLMRKSGAKDYKKYSLKLLKASNKKPISLEVFSFLILAILSLATSNS